MQNFSTALKKLFCEQLSSVIVLRQINYFAVLCASSTAGFVVLAVNIRMLIPTEEVLDVFHITHVGHHNQEICENHFLNHCYDSTWPTRR